MKKKSLILATAFAMALGVGVAVGAHQSKAGVKEAEAVGETTLYCKMEKSWWTADSAAVGAYCWNSADSSQKNAEWPGIRMTLEPNESCVWKYTVPAGLDSVIFTRVNGSGAIVDWGAKTKDQTIPTDGKNLFTITSSSAVWGDPGCEGTWSVYTPSEPDVPAEDGYYLVGSEIGWSYENAIKMSTEGLENDDKAKLIGYEAKAEEEFKVRSYLAGVDTWYGWGSEHNDNYVVESAGLYDIYINKDNHLWVQAHSEPVDPDVPEHDGYYIVGSKSEWKYAGATELTGGEDEQNYAKLLNYTVSAGESFKVRSHLSGVDTWFGIGGDETSAGNYSSETEKAVDIYASKNGELYVFDHVEPDIPAEEGYYICGLDGFRYENATKMTSVVDPGEGENVAYYMNLSVDVNDEIRIRSYFDAQDPKDRWAEPGDDFEKIDYGVRDKDETKDNFKFLIAGYYDVYAKYDGDVFKFYVAPHVESHSVALTAVLFNGKVSEGSQDLAPQIAYEGQEFEPELTRTGYVLLATYTDEEMEHVYVPAEIKSDDVHLYAKYMKVGFYVIAEKDNWKLEEALPMNTAGIADTNKAEAYLNVKANESYSFVEYKSDGKMAGQSGLGEGVDEELATYDATEGGRVKFLKDASVAVYFGKDNNIYLNEGLVAFLTNFKSEVGGVCSTLDPKASEEQKAAYLNALKVVWGHQAVAFNNLTVDEKAEFEKEEHAPEIAALYEEMTAMYDYIIHKYGTSEFNDFIWNQNITLVGNSMPELSTDSNVMLIVIISISAVSVASLGALLILKKKKRK